MSNEPITDIDLHAYVDDQLDPGRRIEVEDYLARHPQAAAAVMADLRTRDALRLLLRDKETALPPAMIQAARRLDHKLVRQRIVRKLPQAAAMLLIGALSWIAGDTWGDFPSTAVAGSRTPVFVEEALMSHKTALMRAQMPSQQEVPRLDTEDIKAATHIVLPRLPASWRVLDVQLFPSDDGPSLQVMIDRGGNRPLSFFAVRASSAAIHHPIVVRKGGALVAYWQKGEHAYALTGDAALTDLSEIARSLAVSLPS